MLVPITTKPGPLRVPIAANPGVTGLKESSYAKCESVGPAHKSRLKKRIGRLSRDQFAAVEGGVRRVLGLSD